jgi:ribosome biogenesis protein Tsr3
LGVVILDAYRCSFSADIFLDWIRNLPELLVQNEVSYHILMAFSCLGKQSNKVFLQSLESKATDVVGEFDFLIIFLEIKAGISRFYQLICVDSL